MLLRTLPATLLLIALGAPAPTAPLPAIEVEAVAMPSPDGLVVPVTLKPGARQVILKIVIKLDDAA